MFPICRFYPTILPGIRKNGMCGHLRVLLPVHRVQLETAAHFVLVPATRLQHKATPLQSAFYHHRTREYQEACPMAKVSAKVDHRISSGQAAPSSCFFCAHHMFCDYRVVHHAPIIRCFPFPPSSSKRRTGILLQYHIHTHARVVNV